ncbi:MAG: GGDEF domain-containing protein [Myxococcota bacterium]
MIEGLGQEGRGEVGTVTQQDDNPKTGAISMEEIERLSKLVGGERRVACLLALSGIRLGRMYTIDDGPLLIGRSADCVLHLPEDGVSRNHATVEWRGNDVVVRDLDSTNGTFVNGERVRERTLHDGDRLQVGRVTMLRFAWQDELEQQFQQHQYDSATRDGLTGLYSKKYLMEALNTELAFAVRHKKSVVLALIDADHFKRINDTWGHLAGDHVLQQLAQIMQSCVRRDDVLGRYGGEEFAVVMREIPLENGVVLAERIRQRVEQTEFMWQGERLPVTVSLGLATGPHGATSTPEGLLAEADRLLYESKRAGRNRVTVQGPQGLPTS